MGFEHSVKVFILAISVQYSRYTYAIMACLTFLSDGVPIARELSTAITGSAALHVAIMQISTWQRAS